MTPAAGWTALAARQWLLAHTDADDRADEVRAK